MRTEPLMPVVPGRPRRPGRKRLDSRKALCGILFVLRRLRIRWEIRDDIHEAFLSLACAIICYRRLTT